MPGGLKTIINDALRFRVTGLGIPVDKKSGWLFPHEETVNRFCHLHTCRRMQIIMRYLRLRERLSISGAALSSRSSACLPAPNFQLKERWTDRL